ncbi:MAG: ATP-binding protein [Clostridiales bacterium]|nr:ATP-binding protein [Clostridiales bacterium]
MERFALQKLIDWKDSRYRKPLILRGARQVGKTWLLKEFGKTCYENIAYFNFDEHEEYKQFFENTKDIRRILDNLTFASGSEINPGSTLIIFDEIQECPKALNTLKYFYENANEYHVVCAGSLLGISLAKPSSFPVGMVNFLNIYPMTFTEFLLACGNINLKNYLDSINIIEEIPDAFFNPLCEKLKIYFVTGGMPEVVRRWAEEKRVEGVQETLSDIISSYEKDFAKHTDTKDIPKINMIWKSVPSQLAKENKKFLYKVVKEGARAREYEDALDWLCEADLLTKIFRISKPALPLSAYDDLSAFKIYLMDVGIFRKVVSLAPSAITEGNRLFTEFKGALTENFILQSLKPEFEVTPRYWATDNPKYEVDFVIQRENDIIPIEVKSSTDKNNTSLRKFKEIFSSEYEDKQLLRIRFSLRNLCLDKDVLNIPLFMADYTNRLISLAKKSKNTLA